ncbi:MAG: methylated-DNA--[protein]-cysteine S-methyltransferase [Thermodesulfovibrionales bacterium]|nr:methylated-DNA--[protein]-cysteine S-methyltransferase [Thermodesulfovibrionales bacterium]
MDEARLFFDTFLSPIGRLYIVFAGKKLAGISMKKPSGVKAGAAPGPFKAELSAYFSGRLGRFKQEIALLEGTEFERQVWLGIKGVPYGEMRTYKWLSEQIGRPGAYRAVGQALSKNPIPIVLPCHRIIESDGHIGGYSGGGVEIKRRLLDMEYYHSIR